MKLSVFAEPAARWLTVVDNRKSRHSGGVRAAKGESRYRISITIFPRKHCS
jgi:hypothetical protein